MAILRGHRSGLRNFREQMLGVYGERGGAV